MDELRILPVEEVRAVWQQRVLNVLRMYVFAATYASKRVANFGACAVTTGLRGAGRGFVLSAHAARSRVQRWRRDCRELRDRLNIYLTKLYIFYFVRIDVRRKCPACGYRVKHKVTWSAAHKHLLHMCPICEAVSAEPPLVRVASWEVGSALALTEAPEVKQGKEEQVRSGMMRVVQ